MTAAPMPESPEDKQGFATKPALAATLIDRAVAAQVPAAWVAGDEVYGADPRLRAAIRGHGLGYVMAIAANRRVPTHAGPIRVDALPALIPTHAWQKHSAGAGAHGPRLYSWAWFRLLAEDDTDTGVHHLLIRRNDATGEHAYLRCYSPRAGAAAHAGGRGRSALAHRGILPGRQRTGRARSAPGPTLALLAPLDHPGHARPCLPGRGHRDRTRHRTHPDRTDHVDRQRISPTLRRPAAGHPPHHRHPAGLVTMATTTPIPSPPIPLPTTRTPMIPIYGCSTRSRSFTKILRVFTKDAKSV